MGEIQDLRRPDKEPLDDSLDPFGSIPDDHDTVLGSNARPMQHCPDPLAKQLGTAPQLAAVAREQLPAPRADLDPVRELEEHPDLCLLPLAAAQARHDRVHLQHPRAGRRPRRPDPRRQGPRARRLDLGCLAAIGLSPDRLGDRLALAVGELDAGDLLEQVGRGGEREVSAQQRHAPLDTGRDLARPLLKALVGRVGAARAGPAVVIGPAVGDLTDERARPPRDPPLTALRAPARAGPARALLVCGVGFDLVAQR